MICAVHAVIGAAVGRMAKKNVPAFTAGVATHLLGDLTPHKDFSPKTELPLLAVTMLLIALVFGIKSPEFWGAFGGIAPDFENAAYVHGFLPKEKLRFPTHVDGGKYHATPLNTALPQGILVLLCLWYLWKTRKK